jgi:uncharacterized protein YqgC (DUF456 family)
VPDHITQIFIALPGIIIFQCMKIGYFCSEYVAHVNNLNCNAFSFGYLLGVQVLKADVSELSVGSIFIGRSMKCDGDWSVLDIYTELGSGKPEQSQ